MNKITESLAKLDTESNALLSTDFVPVDVSKESVVDNTGAEHRFLKGLFDATTKPETSSVVPQTAKFKEGTIRRCNGPLYETFWPFDMELPSNDVPEIIRQFQK